MKSFRSICLKTFGQSCTTLQNYSLEHLCTLRLCEASESLWRVSCVTRRNHLSHSPFALLSIFKYSEWETRSSRNWRNGYLSFQPMLRDFSLRLPLEGTRQMGELLRAFQKRCSSLAVNKYHWKVFWKSAFPVLKLALRSIPFGH